jgi:hypothetical protein
MRFPITREMEQGRVQRGPYKSPPLATFGAFEVTCPATGSVLFVIFSSGVDWPECGFSGEPWEHASVSVLGQKRCPTWWEMQWVKEQFWADEEAVVQIHPPKSTYRNFHEFTLHLFRPTSTPLPLPPPDTVGPAKGDKP